MCDGGSALPILERQRSRDSEADARARLDGFLPAQPAHSHAAPHRCRVARASFSAISNGSASRSAELGGTVTSLSQTMAVFQSAGILSTVRG
jgi:hypothetical protein